MAKGLGKGLDDLFSDTAQAYGETYENGRSMFEYTEEERNNASEIPLSQIRLNPSQPRKNFDDQAMQELAASIKQHGVIMPVVVNDSGDGTYLMIAGERRFRAASIAGLDTIPAVVRTYTEREIKEISLIENLQREDLNPIEAASAMKQLMTDYKLTQDDLAERLGKSRPAVANMLRLLNLTPDVMDLVAEGKLSAGHAKTLVPLKPEDQKRFAEETLKKGYTVRELEKAVKAFYISQGLDGGKGGKKKAIMSVELKTLADRMRAAFRTKVGIMGNDRKGRIYIDYYSRDDLERINEILDIVDRQK